MKTYAYSGYTTEGSKTEGIIEALNLKSARERLLLKGVYTKNLSDVDIETASFSRNRIKPSLRAQVYRELSTLLKSGNALDDSISLLLETAEFEHSSIALAKLRDQIRSGDSFSSTLGSISSRWKDYESAILEVGETTGTLSQSMNTLADFLEDEEVLKEQTQTALLYPLIIMFFAVMIVGSCSFWLLPLFQNTLMEAGISLPMWTQIFIVLGRLFSVGFVLLSLGGLLSGRYIRKRLKNPSIASALERSSSRIPGLTSYLQSAFTYRFCRTYSALLDGGVLLVEAFPLAVRSSGSAWMKVSSAGCHESLKRGESLANILSRLPWVSHSVPGWIRAGEESGAVSEMFLQAGERARRQADRLRERGLKLLEPVMIVIIGLFILGLSFALLGPIMSLNDSLMQ